MPTQNYYYFLLLITLMGSVSLFATDIYLPALPEMALYFNCTQTEIQASFTVFLLGLATCHLVAGVLSDRFGRKKILIIGFVLFTIASLMCAFATTLSELITFRLMQAIGGGVGSVIYRALVVDKYDRNQSVKIFSTVFPVIGLSAAVAPFIGGYLTYFWGWRSTFFMISGWGFIILLMVIFCLQEKNIIKAKDNDLSLKPVLSKIQGYLSVLRNLEFIGYALIICAGFCVFRSYTVESPFVFSNQGYSAEEIGQFYIGLSVAYLAGNLTARKLASSMKVEKLLNIGFLFFVFGGICMIGSSMLFSESPYAIIVPMSFITFGNGFLFPVGSAAALTAIPTVYAGTASGLMGAYQFVIAAVCINWVGDFSHGQSIYLSIFIGAIILTGLCSYLFLVVYKPKTRLTVSEGS